MNNEDLELIRDFTSTVEKRKIAGDYGYQKDTISAIIRGDRRITLDNLPVFENLLKKAKANKLKEEKKQPQKIK